MPSLFKLQKISFILLLHYLLRADSTSSLPYFFVTLLLRYFFTLIYVTNMLHLGKSKTIGTNIE